MSGGRPVLVLNAGSSSLKYQLLVPRSGDVLAKGLVERIGESPGGTGGSDGGGAVADHEAAIQRVLRELAEAGHDLDQVRAVGHRVVHGGAEFSDPVVIDDAVVDAIEDLVPLAPLHNPGAVAGIRAARAQLPGVAQVAVFDTAFFTSLPPAARTYAIPRELAAEHRIRRYGFHGTSHQYVSAQTAAFLGRDLGELSMVVFHLGNGCSASAVAGGRAVDTSMGLTPLEGLVMGTRSGDVDPSLAKYLADVAGLGVAETDTLLNKRSGLKGLSGVNDFRELIGLVEAGDEDARLAFDVYVHRLRHYLGAYAAVLGRLDVVVFTAGVGENNAQVRAAALADLPVLGIELEPDRNAQPSRQARVISTDASAVTVVVVPTNEELAIAQQTAALVP